MPPPRSHIHSVQPKRGRALIWPSVLNTDVLKIDGRTIHEAKPVIRGRKFAANTWIHAYDYHLATSWYCVGAGGDGNTDAGFVAGLIKEEEEEEEEVKQA